MTDDIEPPGRAPDAFDDEPNERSYSTCGRRRKKHPGRCARPAGWGTVHPGKGACKLHGGIRSAERDRRLKSGMYSKVAHVRLEEIMCQLHEAGNQLDVTQDLTLARAIVIDWTERHATLLDAFLEWNRTRLPEDRPAKVPDLGEILPAIEVISRIVYRIERTSSDKHIPRGTFYRIMMAMGRAVDLRVYDEAVKEQIREDWLRIEAV